MFGDKRSKALPDVPTMKELGYDLEYYLWVGLFAPKGTPDKVVHAERAINKAATVDTFKTAVANLGQEPGYLDQPDFRKFWDTDAAALSKPCGPSAACKADAIVGDDRSGRHQPRPINT